MQNPAAIIDDLRLAINNAYLLDEADAITILLSYLKDYNSAAISAISHELVSNVRNKQKPLSFVASFLHEYDLNSEEGIVLMEIAEALLRIPDAETQNLFLQEKIRSADWQEHILQSDSLLVNLSTSALMLTGVVQNHLQHHPKQRQKIFDRLLDRVGSPLIYQAIKHAMHQLAYQFVMAENISTAVQLSQQDEEYCYSFDMLGEAALTANDAEKYFHAYLDAIKHLTTRDHKNQSIFDNPGISIKLSALCPRYVPMQHLTAVNELTAKLLFLVKQARLANISVTIDAEETERLDMSLTVFYQVLAHPDLQNWHGFGLAVQAYQKRALATIHWLAAVARQHQRIIPLRLVKGAYWDSEIKKAQENGLNTYPVFTQKSATDISFLACAKLILRSEDAFYPQFATHNAYALAAVQLMGQHHPGYEFQRLHGMGEQLYTELRQHSNRRVPCRIYAPVGLYHQLLPYLVRRLLENGANTSFINQIENPQLSIASLCEDPVSVLQKANSINSRQLVLPKDLYGEERRNSQGINLNDLHILTDMQQQLDCFREHQWQACPLVKGKKISGKTQKIFNPTANKIIVGTVVESDQKTIEQAINCAAQAYQDWRLCPAKTRAEFLLKAAELLENNRLELVALCIQEGGRTIKDACAEVREAVDFCRYYAQSAIMNFSQPISLKGPTGETNELNHYGRGVFVCISPWNFPIAIFIGQITAALAAGNTVIAKPSRQTPLTAYKCIQILHQSGIPEPVLNFLTADGSYITKYCLSDERIAGVAFTGSTLTAQNINRQLAQHQKRIIPLIAETGGQNVLIADSSAQVEQLVADVIQSAFNSAGQRCSALRVLYIQDEIYDRVKQMLVGAMQLLTLGDPGKYSTDIGPVISQSAVKQLQQHIIRMEQEAHISLQYLLNKNLQEGSFFPPTLIELTSLQQLQQEVFGPILHLIRYSSSQLAEVINAVNQTGYGLTLGIHSRIDTTIQKIQQNVRVGNIYVNRDMVGAVVGVQPFGGMGLSGSGPKAGGPHYLLRFAVEQTLTRNLAAVGGTVSLFTHSGHSS